MCESKSMKRCAVKKERKKRTRSLDVENVEMEMCFRSGKRKTP